MSDAADTPASRLGGKRPNAGRKPGTKNRIEKTLQDLTKPHTEAAIAVLVEVLADNGALHQMRLMAAMALLDCATERPKSVRNRFSEIVTLAQLKSDFRSA
jgi:hypothetical protein